MHNVISIPKARERMTAVRAGLRKGTIKDVRAKWRFYLLPPERRPDWLRFVKW